MKNIDKHDILIVQKLKYPPRICGFDNFLEFVSVRKYKDKIVLFVSLIPEGLKLTDLGYTDDWSRKKEHNKVIEQIRIIMNKTQSKKLIEELQKRL